MKKNKNKKLLGYGIISALAVGTTIAVPVALTVNYDSSSNKIELSNDLLLSIWNEVQKQVSELTDLNDVNSVQNILVDKINEILKNSGILDTSVTSVNITLSPSIDGTTQIAKPVTISFSNNITGESENFDINSNQLISKNPIVTNILNNQTSNGFDLSSVSTNIWDAINSVVNTEWTDIKKKTQLEQDLVSKINEITQPLGVTAKTVNINLELGDTHKIAKPILIEFNEPIVGDFGDNFQYNSNSLTTIPPIQTGILNNMTVDGLDLSSVNADIYAAITAKVNSNWTDITEESTIESGLVDAINKIVGPLGGKVTNVDITLENGTTYKEANPITITFEQTVTGTYDNFSASGKTLVTKAPIQTGIYNNMTPDGLDLSSVNADIYAAITAKVNSNWIDITEESTIESGLVEAINKIVGPLGGKVTNVDITLTDGTTYKEANPITITFEQTVAGTYDNFSASGKTLVTKAPIQTGISKFMSPDGIIIPEDVEINIWNTVIGVVNKSWTSITEKSQIESNLVPAIQQYLNNAGVPLNVVSVSIQLTDNIDTSFKDAMPITITFDQNVAGNYKNFEINSSNKTQLISTTPIETGISIYYLDNGNIIIPEVALNSIRQLLSNVCEKYWNVNSSDPSTGLGQNYNTALQDANNLLPKNFPMTINSFGKWGNNLTTSPSGKMIANIALSFSKDGQVVNNFEIPPGIGSDFATSYYGGVNYLVVNNITTNVDCLYFTTSIQEQLLNIVKPYIKQNWNSNTAYINSAINVSELIQKINEILPIDPSVREIASSIGCWGNQFTNPPTPEDDASYKWVRINIGFNGNWPIGCDSSSYVYTGGYGGTNYLIVYVETNVSN